MKCISRRTLLVAGAVIARASAACAGSAQAVLYKSPGCDCCERYGRYLQANGIKVETVDTSRIVELSRAAGIPEDFIGCHVTSLAGYVVAGHIPVAAIRKLLADRPALFAITVPAMPDGAPGMGDVPGYRPVVYGVSRDGSAPTVFSY